MPNSCSVLLYAVSKPEVCLLLHQALITSFFYITEDTATSVEHLPQYNNPKHSVGLGLE